MNCKSNVKINFDGGNLSSDSGLLLYKDFIEALNLKETPKHVVNNMVLLIIAIMVKQDLTL